MATAVASVPATNPNAKMVDLATLSVDDMKKALLDKAKSERRARAEDPILKATLPSYDKHNPMTINLSIIMLHKKAV